MSIEQQIWDRGDEGKDTSYLKEMLLHPISRYGLLGAISAAAILSIPFGLGVGALPLLGFAAAEGIASLFVPSSSLFRASIDQKKRAERRERTRQQLMNEIERRVPHEDVAWNSYRRLRERLASLHTVAQDRKTALSGIDVERLDDATVSYLGLWLALLLIEERRRTMHDDDLRQEVADIEVQIEQAKSPLERRRFEKAKDDLERLLRRREGLASQEVAVRTALFSMVDTFEEAYQQIVTDPTSSEAARHLLDAVERLRIEEGLDSAIDDEIETLFRQRSAKGAAKVAAQ